MHEHSRLQEFNWNLVSFVQELHTVIATDSGPNAAGDVASHHHLIIISDASQARWRHWPAPSASATPPSLHYCLQLARKPSQISRSWRVWNGIMDQDHPDNHEWYTRSPGLHTVTPAR